MNTGVFSSSVASGVEREEEYVELSHQCPHVSKHQQEAPPPTSSVNETMDFKM